MIENLKGYIQKKTHTQVVININGMGMSVLMSLNGIESLPDVGNEALILTYLHVREDVLDLYGFATDQERGTFKSLININGIGPKLAITILSGTSPESLKQRIVDSDVKSLTTIPGVGAKTAKRIILELKEKFLKNEDESLGFKQINKKETQLFNDAVNALISLGFKSRDSKRVLIELEEEGNISTKLETNIKLALSKLMS
tara:strand:+ start:55610 stop:56212 length:603 start_codon:yes stop_codon:yes gene_type:complete